MKNIKLFFTYGISQIIVLIIPLILTPVITKNFEKSVYADYSLFKVLISFYSPFIMMGLSQYILKNFYSKIEKELEKYIKQILKLSITSVVILFIITLTFDNILRDFLKFNDSRILYYGLFCTLFTWINELIKNYYRVVGFHTKFLLNNILYTIIFLSLVFIIYCSGHLNLELLLLTHLISITTVSVYAYFELSLQEGFKLRNYNFSLDFFKELIVFSLPVIAYSLINLIINHYDKITINRYLNKSDLAIYFAHLQICFGIAAFGSIINFTWQPYVYKRISNLKCIDKTLFKNTFSLCLLYFVISMLYLLIVPFLQNILLPFDYGMHFNFYVLLVFGFFFQNCTFIFQPFLIGFDRKKYLPIFSFICGMITLALNTILVRYGIIFAAMSFLCTWFTSFLLYLMVFRKLILINQK